MKTLAKICAVMSGVVFLLLLCVQVYATCGERQWAADGVSINNELAGHSTSWGGEMAVVSDSSGGMIMVWEDYRNGNWDIYAQKVNSSGVVQWNENGVAVCTDTATQRNPMVCSDDDDGVIIVWYDERDYSITSGDIYAQRLAGTDGSIQWSTGMFPINGIAVCKKSGQQRNPHIVADGNGGAIFMWDDARAGATDDRIYGQRFPAVYSGPSDLLWGVGGTLISTDVEDESITSLISDGSNGAVVVWESYINGNWDVFAQRVDGDGNTLWSADTTVCGYEGTQQWVSAIALDTSGVMVVWDDARGDIYGQLVDWDGNLEWDSDGVQISEETSSSSDKTYLVSDGADGAIVGWIGGPSNYNIRAQRIDSNGTLLWPSFSQIALFITWGTTDNGFNMVSDGNGGAIFTWYDWRNNTDYNAYAQKVDASGDVRWQTNGAIVCAAAKNQVQPALVLTATNDVIIAWFEYTTSNTEYAVKAQRVDQTAWSTKWYVAEGSTVNYQEWLSIMNPHSAATDITVTFTKDDGTTVVYTNSDPIDPYSRHSINVNSEVPDALGVSAVVEATNALGVIVERPMYFSNGGHCASGVTDTSMVWYLAEGSASGYQEWLSILNYNDYTNQLSAEITYMASNGSSSEWVSLDPDKRYTVNVNNSIDNLNLFPDVDLNKEQIGVKLEVPSNSNKYGVVVERPMYFDIGGHCTTGVPYTARTWYLAEGATHNDTSGTMPKGQFSTWICMLNPNDTAVADVTVTFMKDDGSTVEYPVPDGIAAGRRVSIDASLHVPNETGFSTKVVASEGIVVERPIYWDWGGTVTTATTDPSTEWYLAEGTTQQSYTGKSYRRNYETWVCVANDNAVAFDYTITFMKGDGTTVPPVTRNILATSRDSFLVSDYVDNEPEVSTKIESPYGVVVERSVYWYDQEQNDDYSWTNNDISGGHCNMGIPG